MLTLRFLGERHAVGGIFLAANATLPSLRLPATVDIVVFGCYSDAGREELKRGLSLAASSYGLAANLYFTNVSLEPRCPRYGLAMFIASSTLIPVASALFIADLAHAWKRRHLWPLAAEPTLRRDAVWLALAVGGATVLMLLSICVSPIASATSALLLLILVTVYMARWRKRSGRHEKYRQFLKRLSQLYMNGRISREYYFKIKGMCEERLSKLEDGES